MAGPGHSARVLLATAGALALEGNGPGRCHQLGYPGAVPTVLTVEDLRFFFFSNEGTEPPHVHVEAGDSAAKFWLEPVELAVNHGLKRKDLRRARLLVEANQQLFLEKWHEHFDT